MSQHPRLTVALCTHAPRADHLVRTLDALARQTLPQERWELLVIDNASPEPVAPRIPLHLPHRLMVEATPGIGAARRRAFTEAAAPLLCFIDDDNLPAPDYLEQGLALADTHSHLGAWGGQLLPEWEQPPPAWLGDYRRLLGLQEVPHDAWSLDRYRFDTLPPTAGMFVRAEVGAEWRRQVAADPRRALLGSVGRNANRGEDTDLAFCAHDLGLGTGLFSRLRLTHLMSRERLTLRAVAELVRGSRRSMYLLFALRGRNNFPRPRPRLVHCATALEALLGGRARWTLWRAEQQAIREARELLARIGSGPGAGPAPRIGANAIGDPASAQPRP